MTAREQSPAIGPSVISSPNCLAKLLRNVERFSAPSIPSLVQKRLCAKGRSAEMLSTVTPLLPAAFLLNVRTEVAQTLVSRLGKTFRTFLPLYEESLTSERSVFARVKSGAVLPTAGRA